MLRPFALLSCAVAIAVCFSACSDASDSEDASGSDGGAADDDVSDDDASDDDVSDDDASDDDASDDDASDDDVSDDDVSDDDVSDDDVSDDDASDDDASDDDASAGNDQDAAAPATGGPAEPLPLADEDFDTSMLDEEEALQQLVGEYDVVIYYAPEDSQSDIGRGSIVVDYDGDIVHLALKGADGNILVEVENSRVDPVDYGQASFTQVLGKILVDQRDTPHERIDVTLSPNGSIYGYVGGSGQYYQFRNNIVHYGPTPPAHLLTQVGTWAGPQLALTCEQPTVTVEIGDDASVLLSGTANLDCEPGMVENQWDGQDDYVVPGALAGTVDIVIDSTHGGGSQATGGVWLTVNEDPEVVGLYAVKAVLEGFRGNLEAANPEKQ